MHKVAILGGSFNPITNAHLQIANSVLSSLPEIERVGLMPSYNHPFGKDKDYRKDRIELLRLVETDKIKMVDYDKGTSYDTFKFLSQVKDVEFYLIIGADCVHDFPRWHKFDQLMNLVKFIVVPREGYDLTGYVGGVVRAPNIYLKDLEPIKLSSTEVRAKILLGESVENLVPKPVFERLKQNGI